MDEESAQKMMRLVRLAENTHRAKLHPCQPEETSILIEPSHTIYTQVVKTVCLFLSLTGTSRRSRFKEYDLQLRRLRGLFGPRSQPTSKKWVDFVPGHFGHGWPRTVSEIHHLVALSVAYGTRTFTNPVPQPIGQVVRLSLPSAMPNVFLRIPATDLIAAHRVGLADFEWSWRYGLSPLATWANNPGFIVRSRQAALASNLPIGRDHEMALRAAVIPTEVGLSVTIGSITAMTLGSLFPELDRTATMAIGAFLTGCLKRRIL
ncbi:MAG: hypothetical protein HC927_02460 [Deltaproteobacteria bacterium]|nr:hypothetical protein [Deltaproteobacteria bacterium]